jgi:hypothetical protein
VSPVGLRHPSVTPRARNCKGPTLAAVHLTFAESCSNNRDQLWLCQLEDYNDAGPACVLRYRHRLCCLLLDGKHQHPELVLRRSIPRLALPCERFTSALGDIRASLGAGAVRYSFTVVDFHRLPLAGLPAHPSRHAAIKTSNRPRALRKGADVKGRASVRDESSASSARWQFPSATCRRRGGRRRAYGMGRPGLNRSKDVGRGGAGSAPHIHATWRSGSLTANASRACESHPWEGRGR